MILGYSILAVPTGILTAEMGRMSRPEAKAVRTCAACKSGDHEADAAFCKRCGAKL